jgi:hypothetical protein
MPKKTIINASNKTTFYPHASINLNLIDISFSITNKYNFIIFKD